MKYTYTDKVDRGMMESNMENTTGSCKYLNCKHVSRLQKRLTKHNVLKALWPQSVRKCRAIVHYHVQPSTMITATLTC